MERPKFEIKTTAARLFCLSGRATRKEYWLTVVGLSLAMVLLSVLAGVAGGIGTCITDFCVEHSYSFLAKVSLYTTDTVVFVIGLATVALIYPFVALLFRRLHDLGLSGFWTLYLSPLGLYMMYGSYILEADESVVPVIDRIRNVGSPWLSWILAYLAWPVASLFGVVLVLFAVGQKKDNLYGANPYAVQ